MAVRKKKTQTDYVQFSKKLITAVMFFWALIRLISVVAVIIEPSSGSTMAAIVRGVDDIAMINCLAYTGNSVSEKIALGYFQMKTNIAKKDENGEDENENGELEKSDNG